MEEFAEAAAFSTCWRRAPIDHVRLDFSSHEHHMHPDPNDPESFTSMRLLHQQVENSLPPRN